MYPGRYVGTAAGGEAGAVAANSRAAGASSRLSGCEGACSCPQRPVRCVGYLAGDSHNGLTPSWGPERPLRASRAHRYTWLPLAMLGIYGDLFHFHCGFIHICDTIFGKIFPDSRDFGFEHGGRNR